jgi:Putative sensor/2TM domain
VFLFGPAQASGAVVLSLVPSLRRETPLDQRARVIGKLRTLVFLLAAVPVAPLALAVLIAGCAVVPVVAIMPLVIPALVGFRYAVGELARLDGGIANGLLGTSVNPPLRSPGPRGFWRSGLNVLSDGALWRQQAYLLLRLTVGFAVAVAEFSLLASSLGALTLPIWYRWSATGSTPFPRVGSWHVDTLGRALLGVPVGIVGLAIGLLVLGPLAAGSRRLVVALLAGVEEGREPTLRQRRASLKAHAETYAVVTLVLTLIWALTSRGYFWPEWTFIVLGLPLAFHALAERWRAEGIGSTRLAIATATDTPVLFVRHGSRPAGLGPPGTLTRFTWTRGSGPAGASS